MGGERPEDQGIIVSPTRVKMKLEEIYWDVRARGRVFLFIDGMASCVTVVRCLNIFVCLYSLESGGCSIALSGVRKLLRPSIYFLV